MGAARDQQTPPEPCEACNGSGLVGELQDCVDCHGSGDFPMPVPPPYPADDESLEAPA